MGLLCALVIVLHAVLLYRRAWREEHAKWGRGICDNLYQLWFVLVHFRAKGRNVIVLPPETVQIVDDDQGAIHLDFRTVQVHKGGPLLTMTMGRQFTAHVPWNDGK